MALQLRFHWQCTEKEDSKSTIDHAMIWGQISPPFMFIICLRKNCLPFKLVYHRPPPWRRQSCLGATKTLTS